MVVMASPRSTSVSEQLRAAIAAAPVTRYRIAQETGVSESALSRFARGTRSLDLASVDRVAQYLNLVLRPATPARRRKDA
jgi:transcriptional regulator with XRE-family HTH domain